MSDRVEDIVISNLLYNEEYSRRVIPNTDSSYFSDKLERKVVDTICSFFKSKNKLPTKKIIAIELSNTTGLSDSEFSELGSLIQGIEKPTGDEDLDWLVDSTEKFYKQRAVYNAILECVTIIDGSNKKLSADSMPALLSDALAVSFDASIGHNYFNDAESRYEFYHQKSKRIPTDLDIINKVTRGGFPVKSLNVFMAATGVGKSMVMCHFASAASMQGYNVLYITMEMAEEKISERLDLNNLDLTMDELHAISKKSFVDSLRNVKSKGAGEIYVKEYPTGAAHAGHFKSLLRELKMKKGFKPDIIFIDYLNICASERIKSGSGVNSYTYIKSIAEELRAMAVEFEVPIVSATQTNKDGITNVDPDLTNTSESMGLTHTVDFMAAIISMEELEDQGQILFKILKNRYNDLNYYKKFVTGIDRSKMRFYNVENSAQGGVSNGKVDYRTIPVPKKSSSLDDIPFMMDDIPVFDRSNNFILGDDND